jgi:hypothetical protein
MIKPLPHPRTIETSDESIMLYKTLLEYSKDIRGDYLKNVETFSNQLLFNNVSEQCYIEMYSKIQPKDEIPSTTSFFEKIDGLNELNKEAYSFFMKKRNNSVKGLDVQLGNKFEEVFIEFLNSIKVKAGRADVRNRRLPDIHVLDRTRNIKAYIELKYHHSPFMLSHKLLGRESYEGSITLDTQKLQRQIIECESELPNRPVYIVHWVDFHHLKGIFFNTMGQIKEYLEEGTSFERKERSGDYIMNKKIGYTEKFYPPLHEMGDFSELIRHLS